MLGRSKKKKPDERRKLRPRFRLTGEGKVYVFVALGVGLAAVNTGNNLLYLVLGLMLSALLVSGTLSDLSLWGLRIRRVVPAQIFAAQPAQFEIEIRNTKRWFSSFSIEVEDVAPNGEQESSGGCFFLKVPPKGTQRVPYPRTFSSRGEQELLGFQIRTRFPFGLIEKGRTLRDPATFVKYPTPLPPEESDGEPEASAGDLREHQQGLGHEVDGIREYKPGDDARAIHWRRSARLDQIVVRKRKPDNAPTLSFELDDQRAVPGEAFEHAVSTNTGGIVEAHRSGFGVRFESSSGFRHEVRAGERVDPLLRWLGLVEPGTKEGQTE